MYSKSQNNVNIVYCNYKENTSSYSVITERNLPHSLPNVGIIFECLSEPLKKHVILLHYINAVLTTNVATCSTTAKVKRDNDVTHITSV